MYHSVTDNWQLESFMREFGILMPTPFEELQEANNLRIVTGKHTLPPSHNLCVSY